MIKKSREKERGIFSADARWLLQSNLLETGAGGNRAYRADQSVCRTQSNAVLYVLPLIADATLTISLSGAK